MQVKVRNIEIAASLPTPSWDRNTPKIRKGWELLGWGGGRAAYLGPDGLVYKKSRSIYGPEQNQNEAEASVRLRKSRKLPEWCYIPKVYYADWVDVIVTEFMGRADGWEQCGQEGSCIRTDCVERGIRIVDAWEDWNGWMRHYHCTCGLPVECWQDRMTKLEDWGLSDLHAGNIRVLRGQDDYKLAVIDLGL